MSRPAAIRWSFADLDAALRRAGYESRAEQTQVLGVDERTLWRWKAEGVPEEAADRVALDIGSHPSRIWDDWKPPVARVLREARQASGKSLKVLATETGLNAGFLSRMERGERPPTLRVLHRYCPAVGLPDPMELLAHWYWDVAEAMQSKGVAKNHDGSGGDPELVAAPLGEDHIAC